MVRGPKFESWLDWIWPGCSRRPLVLPIGSCRRRLSIQPWKALPFSCLFSVLLPAQHPFTTAQPLHVKHASGMGLQ
jgi:hypothetical protein